MTLFDAWNTMHDEYERIYHDPNASPEEKMRIISHQSVGETYSFNGLLLIRRQDMERIPEGDKRFEAFRKFPSPHPGIINFFSPSPLYLFYQD